MSTPGLGAAVVLRDDQPSPSQLFAQFRQEARERKNELYRREQQERARQAALAQYVGQEFNPNDFAGVLNEQVLAKRKYWTDYIRQNPGADIADLSSLMSKDMAGLSDWSNTAKEGMAQIKQASDEYVKKGFDRGLQALATKRFLYNYDPKTGWSLKSPDQLKEDSTKDFVEDTIQKNPEFVVDTNDDNPLRDLKGEETFKGGYDYKTTNSKGGSFDNKLDYEIYPNYQTLDTSGKEPKVVRRGVPVKDDKGNTLYTMADDTSFDAFMHNPLNRAKAAAKFKREIGESFDPNNESHQNALRTIVYDWLPQSAKSFVPHQVTKENPVNTTTSTTITEGGDEKPNKVTYNSVLAGAMRGGDFDKQSVYNKDYQMNDILPALGGQGFKTIAPNGKVMKATKILYQPGNRKAGYKVFVENDETGKEDSFTVPQNKLHDWMSKQSRAHSEGGNFTSGDEDVNRNFDEQGNLITPIDKLINKRKIRTTTTTRR